MKKKKTFIVDIPEVTAQELYQKTGNKLGEGKLLYNIDWYENEPFFTTEKSRAGHYEIEVELLEESRNKTHVEQDELLRKNKAIRFNFAEVLYIAIEYYKQTGNYWLPNGYYWTCSLSSDGGLVVFGACAAVGANVDDWLPRVSGVHLGVVLSRSVEVTGESVDSVSPTSWLDLEKRVTRLEKLFNPNLL
jgi:hypothetical protein